MSALGQNTANYRLKRRGGTIVKHRQILKSPHCFLRPAGWPLRAGLVLSALLLSLPHMMDYDAALHGLLLLAALPLARGRERWLLALAFADPLLGEAARTLHVALIPAILLAVTVRFGWAARGEAAGAR